MQPRAIALPLLLLIGCCAGAALARTPTGTVELRLIGDTRGSAMVFQEWIQALGKAGIRNVRIETNAAAYETKIDVQGNKDRPVYIVTGIIKSREELILPGARFRRSDMGRLSQWLDELATQGPPDQREAKGVFGLPLSQLEPVRVALGAPVGFSTQDMTCDQVVARIAKQLKSPPKLDAGLMQALSAEKMAENLESLSCGTALAYALGSVGYGLTVHESSGSIVYSVTKAAKGMEVWPVGWPAEKIAAQVAPAFFEFHNVNVQNVSAADALKAIAGRSNLPVLIDHKAIQQREIDPAKTLVSFPKTRTTYGIALRKLLFQARLKYEVRCDEANTPFLWVTTIKPT